MCAVHENEETDDVAEQPVHPSNDYTKTLDIQ